MNASATIGNLQTAAGSGSTPPVGAGAINAAADQLRAAQVPVTQNSRPVIPDTTPVSDLRADPLLSSMADQLLQQVAGRAPWLFRPTAGQATPTSHQHGFILNNAGQFTARSQQFPAGNAQQVPVGGGQQFLSGAQQVPAGGGQPFLAGSGQQNFTGGQQPLGAQGANVFCQNWLPNIGTNSFRSDKEYKEYLVRSYLSNDMSAYVNLALGRKDINNSNINMPSYCLGQLH